MNFQLAIGIICHGSLGGSTRSALRLAAGLARHGHAVHLLSRGLLPWPVPQGVIHHTLEDNSSELDDPSRSCWPARLRAQFEELARDVAKKNTLDILHFHYAMPFASIFARVAESDLGRKVAVVGTLHGTDITARKDIHEHLNLCRSLGLIDAVTTVSVAYAHLACKHLGLKSQPGVIANFLSPGEYQPASLSREQHAARLFRPRLIHVSNFRDIKSPDAIGRIFLLVRKCINAELWLVGDGPELPCLRSTLEAAAGSDNVRFFGIQSDIGTWLPHADLLVLASKEESFGLAALEGMAAGAPVLAPRVGGIPEVVTEGITGALFTPGNEEQAALKAVEILSNPRQHWMLRQNAIIRASHFSEKKVLPLYQSLYRCLIRNRLMTGISTCAPPRRGRPQMKTPLIPQPEVNA